MFKVLTTIKNIASSNKVSSVKSILTFAFLLKPNSLKNVNFLSSTPNSKPNSKEAVESGREPRTTQSLITVFKPATKIEFVIRYAPSKKLESI